MVQTTVRLSSPDHGQGVPSDPRPDFLEQPHLAARATRLEDGEIGRSVDRADHTQSIPGHYGPSSVSMPNTSPVYGVNNIPEDPGHPRPVAESVSQSLGHVPSLSESATLGSHVRGADRFEPAVPATITDAPSTNLLYDGQQESETFETAALVLSGPMANTWLGSVSWGWRSDSSGRVTLRPFELVRSGAPSAHFMAAARHWNQQSGYDVVTRRSYANVPLPLTNVDVGSNTSPQRIDTPDLAIRMVRAFEIVQSARARMTGRPGDAGDGVGRSTDPTRAATDEGRALDAVDGGLPTYLLEQRALSSEMQRRPDRITTEIEALVRTAISQPTPDLLLRLHALRSRAQPPAQSAARTDSVVEKYVLTEVLAGRRLAVDVSLGASSDLNGVDEVYVRVRSGARVLFTTDAVGVGVDARAVVATRHGHTFDIPLSALVHSPGPLVIEVFDRDQIRDDVMFTFQWNSPYVPFSREQSRDGGRYRVSTAFDR